VLNTSFNLKGEPSVSSPVQALATFFRSGLDVLYLGAHRVEQTGSYDG
jgi:carbamoyltransferase